MPKVISDYRKFSVTTSLYDIAIDFGGGGYAIITKDTFRGSHGKDNLKRLIAERLENIKSQMFTIVDQAEETDQ